MATISFQEEISRYRIEDWIENDLGGYESKSGAWRNCFCPFHDNSETEAFSVNIESQRWTCWAGCHGGGGDLLDYIQARRFGSIQRSGSQVLEALKVLTGNSFLPPVEYAERRVLVSEDTKKPVPTMDMVKGFAQWGDMATPYFNKRMVSALTVHERLLGCELEHKWYTKIKSTGEEFRLIRRHYTIPNLLGSTVRGIQTRRDDDFCEAQLLTDKGQEAYEQVAGDIAERKGCSILEVRRSSVIDKLFGPKYWRVPGSGGAIFNAQRLLRLEDGQPLRTHDGGWMVNRLPYILVVESEIGAMSLEDAGYPAVAVYKYNGTGLDKPFAGARRVVIIGDNDQDKTQKNGMVWNAGQNKATLAKEAIGRGEVIYPDDPYKDPNEIAQAGELKQWLAGYKITPAMSARISK